MSSNVDTPEENDQSHAAHCGNIEVIASELLRSGEANLIACSCADNLQTHLTVMKRLLLIGTIASLGVTGIFAQDTAKGDMKQAGSDTKQATKDAGKGIKKGSQKTTHAVKKGVSKTAGATEKGAAKVKEKTTT